MKEGKSEKEKPKAVSVVKDEKEVQIVSPVDRMLQALGQGIDPDKIGQMMDYQERWEASEARKAYHVAMSAFKANPPKIVKDKRVGFSTSKGNTFYKHASLFNVTESISQALSVHGLSASWNTAQDNEKGGISVTCKITHSMGHSEQTTLTAQPDATGSKNGIQQIGSTITYLERYTLLALTGLATADQDDDGQASEEVEYIDEKQLGVIRDYIDNNIGFKARLLKYLQVEEVELIPKSQYKKAIQAMEGSK